jgi:hypothetical protein
MQGRSVLLLLLVIAVGCYSQSCTLEDNTDYDNGFLTMLYKIPSAQACCDACNGFQECVSFSWIKNPGALSWYQRCFIKNSLDGKKTDTGQTAGRNGRNPPASNCSNSGVEVGIDYDNGWLSLLKDVPSAAACCDLCNNYPGCNYWTWDDDSKAGDWNHRCYFKASNAGRKTNAVTTSGKATPLPRPAMRTGKRGVAWFNSKSCSDLKLMKGVSWIYNWATLPDASIVPCMRELGIEFIPMQWGGGVGDLNLTIWGGGGHFLGFNEPNFKSQSNVSPQEAAKEWPAITAIANERKLRIGSPSAAACGPNPETECYGKVWTPVPWFDDFFAACTNCKIDFLTTHIYTCDINELKTFIGSLKKYNKPIWLTEFACPASGQSIDVELNFAKEALAYLDSEPQIERYAWFGIRIDPDDGWLGPQVNLIGTTGCALTELGKLYTS